MASWEPAGSLERIKGKVQNEVRPEKVLYIQKYKVQGKSMEPSKSDVEFFQRFYQTIVREGDLEMQERTFKIGKMAEYVKKADAYAAEDTPLFKRICSILENTAFQTDQKTYLLTWQRSLRKLDTASTPYLDVCRWIITQDLAFDFFKENFMPSGKYYEWAS